MKAARYYGPGNIKLDQVPEPQAKEGQVKIKVYYSPLHSICYILSLAPVPDCLVFFQYLSELTAILITSYRFFLSGTAVGGLIFKIFTNFLFLNSLWE
jgi:hypothetical protein